MCYADSDDSWTYISQTPAGTLRCACAFARFLLHGDDVVCCVQLYIWGQLYLLLMARYSSDLACDWPFEGSLVPRPHPVHTRGRGLVSQVQMVWLATWSDQSNCRVAFIEKCRSENKYFSHPAQSDIMKFLIHPTLQFVTYLASPEIQACDTTPFSHQRAGSGYKTSVRCVMSGLGLSTRLVWGVLCQGWVWVED